MDNKEVITWFLLAKRKPPLDKELLVIFTPGEPAMVLKCGKRFKTNNRWYNDEYGCISGKVEPSMWAELPSGPDFT